MKKRIILFTLILTLALIPVFSFAGSDSDMQFARRLSDEDKQALGENDIQLIYTMSTLINPGDELRDVRGCTARVLYKGRPTEDIESISNPSYIGKIAQTSYDPTLIKFYPERDGKEEFRITVNGETAAFTWSTEGISDWLAKCDTPDYRYLNHDINLFYGMFDVLPGEGFGSQGDIKVRVIYQGEATEDYTCFTAEPLNGEIEKDPVDPSWLHLYPKGNGTQHIYIAVGDSIASFDWFVDNCVPTEMHASSDMSPILLEDDNPDLILPYLADPEKKSPDGAAADDLSSEDGTMTEDDDDISIGWFAFVFVRIKNFFSNLFF